MKKIIQYTKYIVLALIISGFSGCEKDNLTLLTDGLWDFSNMTTNSTDDTIITGVAGWKAVRTDATLQFSSDKSYVIDSPLYEEAGTWELVGSTQLIFTSSQGASTASIDNLTKKELKYIETFWDDQQNQFSVISTWAK